MCAVRARAARGDDGSPVTIDCLQPLQVTLHFAAEVAFDRYCLPFAIA